MNLSFQMAVIPVGTVKVKFFPAKSIRIFPYFVGPKRFYLERKRLRDTIFPDF
jgi:hypothetical protein